MLDPTGLLLDPSGLMLKETRSCFEGHRAGDEEGMVCRIKYV